MIQEIIILIITGTLTLLTSLLGILFKKNLTAQAEQSKTQNELAKNVAVLSKSVEAFKEYTEKVTTRADDRMEKQEECLDTLDRTVTRHDTELKHHERRITEIEKRR
ncbi:MAG: hypothetical protein PHT77_12925 [Bacteroidales bacterium]|nr:hypothetical protein [Bacteroidales bacterium]